MLQVSTLDLSACVECALIGAAQAYTFRIISPGVTNVLSLQIARNKDTRPEDMIEVVKDLKPLPGAKEFLDWLKPLVPRILLLTDQ